MSGRLIANLGRNTPLAPEDGAAIEALLGAVRTVPADTELVVDGEGATDCHVLLEGQAFRHKTLPDGRRQIVFFHVPGDLLDLPLVFLDVDYNVASLTMCRVAPVSRAKLADLIEARPRIGRAFWRMSLQEAAIQREWMVGMGRRSAYARVAHLLCEVFQRLQRVDLVQNNRCRFPITQTHLADAAGLSGVHTNRVLQQLRASGLIELRSRELIVRDWNGLAAAGEFDPAYLQARSAPSPALAGPHRAAPGWKPS
ncbi:Crp/Fnr family transcriptional regulator [Phenylobacterium sp.]|uniref:Crp/Fnr family transcriptional regulator n=1 Tax=Phenylobacterium sp. TaxID=1871053 RepID=UPI0025F69509|nr:Crp/Fnr family transcriptional regulator [Phenylobacterium sp.]